jgi:septal ring factor EnvC (AmiA/AmiB activator)
VFVNPGQNVLQDEQIGQINITTGNNNSTLYFEVRKQNKAVNPLLWLQ